MKWEREKGRIDGGQRGLENRNVPSLGVCGRSSPASLEALPPKVLAGDGSEEEARPMEVGAEGVPVEDILLKVRDCRERAENVMTGRECSSRSGQEVGGRNVSS